MTYCYQVFDVNKPIMEENKEFQTDSPKKAIEMYLKSIGEGGSKIQVDGSNYARLSAQPFYIKDGIKYRSGTKRTMWYSIKN